MLPFKSYGLYYNLVIGDGSSRHAEQVQALARKCKKELDAIPVARMQKDNMDEMRVVNECIGSFIVALCRLNESRIPGISKDRCIQLQEELAHFEKGLALRRCILSRILDETAQGSLLSPETMLEKYQKSSEIKSLRDEISSYEGRLAHLDALFALKKRTFFDGLPAEIKKLHEHLVGLPVDHPHLQSSTNRKARDHLLILFKGCAEDPELCLKLEETWRKMFPIFEYEQSRLWTSIAFELLYRGYQPTNDVYRHFSGLQYYDDYSGCVGLKFVFDSIFKHEYLTKAEKDKRVSLVAGLEKLRADLQEMEKRMRAFETQVRGGSVEPAAQDLQPAVGAHVYHPQYAASVLSATAQGAGPNPHAAVAPGEVKEAAEAEAEETRLRAELDKALAASLVVVVDGVKPGMAKAKAS